MVAVFTNIGNTFRKRHSEINQEILESPERVDYLFGRLIALIPMILKTNERGC